MLNKELYAKEIIELAILDESFAVTAKGIRSCADTECVDCHLHYAGKSCDMARPEWANREALVEPELTEVQKLYDNLSYTMKGSILDIMKEAQLPEKKEENET